MSHLPLLGLRVLDLTRVLAGPLATMQLGDLGAHVLKVERPGAGDESRGWGPPFDERGESAYYLCCNRNKLGMLADFANADDVALIRRLAASADVVIENFLPGALARRGLDAATLLAAHPRLVWCTIAGFASEPSRPGYDYVVQAEAGWMSITGEPSGDPMKAGVALADILTGKETVGAVLAAVTGVRGGLTVDRHVTVSLYETAVGALMNVGQNVIATGAPASRFGNAHPNLVPYELFHTRTDPVVIAVGNDSQYSALTAVLAVSALADARFANNAGRQAHRADVVALIADAMRGRECDEVLAAFRDAGVPAGRVRSVQQALATVGTSPLTGIAPQLPAQIRRPPPRLGEHNALVREHGWEAFSRA